MTESSKGFIRNNPATYLIIFGTTVFLIFITTFGGALFAPAVIMYMLIITAVVLNPHFVKGDQPEPDEKAFIQIGIYAVFGLITFLILNIFVPELQFGTGQTVTVNLFTGNIPALAVGAIWSSAYIAAFVFTVFLVPVAEEQFFRVLIGNIALRYLPFFVVIPIIGGVPVIAIVVVGTIFSTFHLAVQGLNYTNLAILWGAGMTLYALDLQAQNPLPSTLSHIGNNGISMLISGNILLQLVPSLGSLSPHIILPLFQLAPLSIFLFYRIAAYNMNRRKIRIDS